MHPFPHWSHHICKSDSFNKNLLPQIYLQHDHWWTSCTCCWFWHSLAWHYLLSRFFKQVWLPSWFWSWPCPLDRVWWTPLLWIQNFSYNYYTPRFYSTWPWTRNQLSWKKLMKLASLMPNMNRQISMILPLANITSCWIINVICLMIYQNTKNIWWLPWNLYHKKVHIELKPGAKLVHHYTYPIPHVHCKKFKKEVFLNHVGPPIGIPCLHYPQKWWVGFTNHWLMLKQSIHFMQTKSLEIMTDMFEQISG